MMSQYNQVSTLKFIIVSFFISLVYVIYRSILIWNDGFFVFTLDDPYIHLALSENIINGHYGINLGESSAPSSSILWPFIISPFSLSPIYIFILNSFFSISSIIVIIKIIEISLKVIDTFVVNILIVVISILFILSTNIVGIIFTGMEHSLQVFSVLLIAYGLIVELEEDKVKWWLLVSIILAPLIRYEGLAISLSAIFYLIMQRRLSISVITFIFLGLLLAAFSLFLMSLGLEVFPSSVTAKSSIVQSGGALNRFVSNLINSLYHRQGIVLLFGCFVLMFYVGFSKSEIRKKQLAIVTILAVFMHLIAGRFGWYNRYEIYILAFELVVILYLFVPLISKVFTNIETVKFSLFSIIIFLSGVSLLIGSPYIFSLSSIPNASNNIYEQQYQMHRFVVDYYDDSVAVNDLGYVSYKNSNYVLDLWGLGSEKALKYRLRADNAHWKQELVDAEKVNLVMIYDAWFQNIPDKWIKIGKLHLGKKRITPARSSVSFYATNRESYPEILKKLNLFSKSLPVGVIFEFDTETIPISNSQ